MNLHRYSKCVRAIILSLSLLCVSPAIQAYDQYFNGDTRYEFAYIQMGSGFYVDRNSVQSLLYQPPYYKLSATIYSTTSQNSYMLSYPHTATFAYDYNTKQVFFCDSMGRVSGRAIRTDTHASEYEMRGLAAAKVIWKIAYGNAW